MTSLREGSARSWIISSRLMRFKGSPATCRSSTITSLSNSRTGVTRLCGFSTTSQRVVYWPAAAADATKPVETLRRTAARSIVSLSRRARGLNGSARGVARGDPLFARLESPTEPDFAVHAPALISPYYARAQRGARIRPRVQQLQAPCLWAPSTHAPKSRRRKAPGS